MAEIRVGVVGAHPERSWAKDSHIPSIGQIPGLKLTAVATRTETSAKAAAAVFGVTQWFTDAVELCRSDAVDLVSVCVKVPEHAAVVRAALAAGKHVYCEWPLGRSVEEAESLATEAEGAGVHHAIGLQGSASPAVRRAREVIRTGSLGRLLSARVVSTTAGYASKLPSTYAYLNDPDSGANLATILGGHTLDLAEQLLGNITELNALSEVQFPEIHLVDTGATIARKTPDQLFVLSRHTSGCVTSIEVGGNRPPHTPFTLEVIGEEANLRLVGGHPHGFQAGSLQLETTLDCDPPEAPVAVGGLHGAAVNVGEIYAALARDIRNGTQTVSNFRHAARMTRVVDAMLQAGRNGRRLPIS